jgi:hypothetical protein
VVMLTLSIFSVVMVCARYELQNRRF